MNSLFSKKKSSGLISFFLVRPDAAQRTSGLWAKFLSRFSVFVKIDYSCDDQIPLAEILWRCTMERGKLRISIAGAQRTTG